MITVLLYKGRKRLFNRFVSAWCRSPYSHCELVLGREDDGSYLCGSSSFLDGGVRVKAIKLDADHWDAFVIPGDDAKASAWFMEHWGEGYDVLGLFGFIFRWIKGWRKSWFCSEACSAALGYDEPWRFDVATFASMVHKEGAKVAV